MLDAWFATAVDPDEVEVIAGLEEPTRVGSAP